MKLLNKTNLIVLTVALFIFFMGGVTFYIFIQEMIIKQVDHELFHQKRNVAQEMKTVQIHTNAYIITENKLIIREININSHIPEIVKDTILYDEYENIYVRNRLLRFHTILGNRNFEISIFRSMLEAEILIEKIVIAMVMMLFALISAMFFLNRYFFQKIWDNFFLTINRVKEYNLHDDPKLNLPTSEIEEFQMLNQVFETLTERVHKDFYNLKEFTENASHEIQTPLSVMRAKIELLLQHPGYSEEQIAQISSLNEAVNRLSNINKVLILLTRIENNQFPELSKIRLKERIDYHLDNFNELIEAKSIVYKNQLNKNTEININTALADVLIINLVKNAIRHNFDQGELIIQLDKDSLEISNTGPKLSIPPEQIFNRFVKSQYTSDSLGLGLSLVHKICELYKFQITYHYEHDFHKMKICFKPEDLS